MINFNGNLVVQSNQNIENNRGFLYGDAVFETFKVFENKLLFREEHYFRLMASLRILRMEIPVDFTLEYFEEQVLKTVQANQLQHARARLTVYRKGDGKYLPNNRSIAFVVMVEPTAVLYQNSKENIEVELFKDFHVSKHLLSTLKTTSCLVNIAASVFAQENSLANCLLINDDKNVIETINGNIFEVKDHVISTPPLTDGCKNGIMRKKIIEIINKTDGIIIEERSISPFELQKADELFFTNTIVGIQSIGQYRKKFYSKNLANDLITKINA